MCAVMRPAASKADQTAEHFGNQPIYLPVVRDDVNNAALALAALERTHVVSGAARKTAPLFVADAAGTPLTCDDVDRMFSALASAALPAASAKRRSFHSCRVFAASCHKAHDEPDEMIQALVRWRTAASLKIYARINPRDYAARVRRMSQTDVDSTISAHLPSHFPLFSPLPTNTESVPEETQRWCWWANRKPEQETPYPWELTRH